MAIKDRTSTTCKLQVDLPAAIQSTQTRHINQNEPNQATIVMYQPAQTGIEWFEKKISRINGDWSGKWDVEIKNRRNKKEEILVRWKIVQK